ncbi:MarR family transcriptional regulator [Lentzea guizhouensis]|uniref:MarR family transcriptional regulator n=1 Tax=Lentzea guizhouensis TaxID=1586287 RepID=A0A1B2HPP6_9PSEU|nr:MarR family winged helix-turn-helix transcriptional regulator [Lentzea guizhouensis]ANZ39688.1 MarR family transcriptional regulator [Lentzea guizhouensis]
MDQNQKARLFELADLIAAVGRQIHASKEVLHRDPLTSVEISAMRFIDRNPGTSARVAAEATQQISSNFSRALRSLENKGLVHREADAEDARRVRLYPTARAQDNLRRLSELWSDLLDGAVSDEDEVESMISALRRIEAKLAEKARARLPRSD